MSRESHWQNDFTVLKLHTLQWFKLACVYVQLFEPTSLYKCGVFLCLVERVCTNLREQLRAEALPGNTKFPAYTNSDSVGFLSEKVRHRMRARHAVGTSSFQQWWAEDELRLTCIQGSVLCLPRVVSVDKRFFRGRGAGDELETESWGHPEFHFPLLDSGGPHTTLMEDCTGWRGKAFWFSEQNSVHNFQSSCPTRQI